MKLRDAKVLARCDDAGELHVNQGRVEIRYSANDGKAYQASKGNLKASGDPTIFEDEFCAAAKKVGASKTKSKSKSSKAAGPTPNAPSADEVLVYCDGACSGNPGPAGLGVVMLWDDHRKELSEFLGHGTNNIAELTAILRAVEGAPPGRRIELYTDSTYSIGVLTKGWKAKANKELITDIRNALMVHGKVALHHVKGHAGVELNEVADGLAVAAVEARATAGWNEVA